MIQAIATMIGVVVTVIVAIWQNRRKAKEIEEDAREDVRQTQIAATAGDEAGVQEAFAVRPRHLGPKETMLRRSLPKATTSRRTPDHTGLRISIPSGGRRRAMLCGWPCVAIGSL
jgi:hypothetical protein